MNYYRTFILCITVVACLVSTAATQGFQVRIDTTIGSKQGYTERVVIRLDSISSIVTEMGGLDLLFQYNPSALSFQGATPGDWLTDCEWEYFTYRYGPNGNCGDTACPSGILRIVALADFSDYHQPTCFGALSGEFADLSFMITNDRQFECQFIPIRFFWYDCGDNSVSSRTGDTLYMSSSVLEEGVNIADSTTGWPTVTGAQYECDSIAAHHVPAIRNIDFINGGVDIGCPDSADVRIGDINLNGIANELADNMMFLSYYIHGDVVFNVNRLAQIAATDINLDGTKLSIEDFVNQTRIIHGEYVQPNGLPLDSVKLVYGADRKSISQVFDSQLGAIFFLFHGSIYDPVLHASGMNLDWAYGGASTTVMVSSIDNGHSFGQGEILSWSGDGTIFLMLAATQSAGRTHIEVLLPTDIVDDDPLVAESPLLHQNYPNPFNNSTVISFELGRSSLVTIDVLDLLGRTVWNNTGRYSPGVHSIDWPGVDKNGNEVASGMYFYRLTSDDYTETRKMLLVK